MKAYFSRLWSNLRFLFKIGVGILILVGFSRFFDSAAWHNTAGLVANALPFVDNVETAVKIVGGLFIVIWGIRFLDRAFYKEQLKGKYGLVPRTSGPGRFITSHLVHVDDQHLYNNTRPLLIFIGIAVLLVPTMETFLLATAIMIIVQGLGVWLLGRKGNHLGASGMLLAYYSFDITYAPIMRPGWSILVTVLLLLIFGRAILANVMMRREGVSFVGHVWGFLSGVLATLFLYQMGL